jgi:microcystin-dependent protein
LCNGSNGTPDLRNRFVVGAGSTYAVDATGGSADATLPTHTHTFSATTNTEPAHNHTYSWGSGVGGINAPDVDNDGTNAADVTGPTSLAGAHSHTVSGTTASAGTSGTNANLPPYYALAYIMKL